MEDARKRVEEAHAEAAEERRQIQHAQRNELHACKLAIANLRLYREQKRYFAANSTPLAPETGQIGA